MKALRELLRDRRRSQRGSVLSGVLIMTAFIAIIAGALMTELSTNFLLSRDLMNRAANEATVDSATELAFNQFETNPIYRGCPDLTAAQATLNGLTAVVNYTSCWPAYRERTFKPIAISPASFSVDGTHTMIPTASPPQDLWVVGDSGGHVYQFPFGSSTPNWIYSLPGSVSAPPTTFRDMASYQTAQDVLTLVPLSGGASPPAACQAGGCLAMLGQDIGSAPDVLCLMAAGGSVTTSATMGVNNSTVAFFGDTHGSLFAYAADERSNCAFLAKLSGGGSGPVSAPIVFAGAGSSDVIYVVTFKSIQAYTYNSGSLAQTATLALPDGAVGVAVEKSTLPARLAISYSDGHLAMVQLNADFSMTLLATARVPSRLQSAPFWCHCQAPADQIAVGGTDGALYILDVGMNLLASLPPGGPSLLATPATDSVGDWFYGASDGYVHEIQQTGAKLVQVNRFGPVIGAISTALQVAPCSIYVCIYLGAQSGNAYRVPLDARDAVFTACITMTAPVCSGANPRLWSSVEVGREGFPNEVHVLGWSYYSA